MKFLIIGVRKETQNHEYRVGLMPHGVRDLLSLSKVKEVWVEKGAGEKAGFRDEDYIQFGAKIVSREAIFNSHIVVGVKELQDDELDSLSSNQADVCFQHYAAHDRKAKCKQYAYEDVVIAVGNLSARPILIPMSIIAGKLAVLEGVKYLFNHNGGLGVVPCPIPGVSPANILVVGAGTAGMSAISLASGMGASVSAVDSDVTRANEASKLTRRANTMMPDLSLFDLVISTVYVPGSKAPEIVDTKLMNPGSVFVDVSIDQGGSSPTSRPTTHDNPVYIENDVIHYCVPNIPGVVGRTATIALCAESIKLIREVIDEF